MIKQNDILMYKEPLEEGDESRIMIALEDETEETGVSMVRVQHINSGFVLRPVEFFEAGYYKVIGKVLPNDTVDSIVARYKHLIKD